jgi:hypothetical protein
MGQESFSLSMEWSECGSQCTYKKLEALAHFTGKKAELSNVARCVSSVHIYKCKFLADSCGSCILLHDAYQCLWCESDKSCRHEANSSLCPYDQVISSSVGICPDPRLRRIHPQVGPEHGRTPIHVYGASLGKKPDDISVVLIHANETEYPCEIQAETYLIAQSFLCRPAALPIGLYTLRVTVHSVVSQDRPQFRVVVRTRSNV